MRFLEEVLLKSPDNRALSRTMLAILMILADRLESRV